MPFLTVKGICNLTADSFGISHSVFMKSQSPRIAHVRQCAMYVSREMLARLSLPQLGRQFGRHHTTILYGIRAIAKRLEAKDLETIAIVGKIKEVLLQRGYDISKIAARDWLMVGPIPPQPDEE